LLKAVVKLLKRRAADPERLFNTLFASLIAAVVGVRFVNWATLQEEASGADGAATTEDKKGLFSLRRRFLAAFWFFKMADWMQGPYFYDVYATKMIGGKPISESVVSQLFVTGFVTSAVLGPALGRLVDSSGRKAGSIAFAIFYSLSALSTHANSMLPLFAGRIFSGIACSLLSAAPESWMVSEHLACGLPESEIGNTFNLAYAGDAIVALVGGLAADEAANKKGPTGPFTAAVPFLAVGGAVVAGTWRENTAPKDTATKSDTEGSVTIADAWQKMLADPRILAVGAVQAGFEAAMNCFIMQWPSALMGVVADGAVPFGKVFSCFMASCMLGGSVLENLVRRQSTEGILAGMLGVSTCAMGIATARVNSLPALVGSFTAFEACVGIYFPAIGTLKSKYIPESHSGLIRTLIGIPMNVIAVTIMLSEKRLGMKGSLTCSTLALAIAFLAHLHLLRDSRAAHTEPRALLGAV
jgi:MFS family permease